MGCVEKRTESDESDTDEGTYGISVGVLIGDVLVAGGFLVDGRHDLHGVIVGFRRIRCAPIPPGQGIKVSGQIAVLQCGAEREGRDVVGHVRAVRLLLGRVSRDMEIACAHSMRHTNEQEATRVNGRHHFELSRLFNLYLALD